MTTGNYYNLGQEIIHRWANFAQNLDMNISDTEFIEHYRRSNICGILGNQKGAILDIIADVGYILLRGVELTLFGKDIAKRLLILLSVELGDPTKTDMVNEKIAWEITPRKNLSIQNTTFSEQDGEAGLHTDTQYYPYPEHFFLLGCYTQAKNGGENILLSLRGIVRALKTQNPRLLEKLKYHKFPFMVPSSFTRSGTDDSIEIFMSPIIAADESRIRYRKDTIFKGLELIGGIQGQKLKKIIQEFDTFLSNHQDVQELLLQNNEILICNNYTLLHGRKDFSDSNRFLFRIRFN